jgi:spore coat-associated protein N
MNLKAKVVTLLATVAIGTSLIGAGTMALFTSSASNTANAFTAGTLTIATSSTPTFSTTNLTFGNMAPGDNGDRLVSVTNTGSLDAWVHINDFTASGDLFNSGGLTLSDTTGAIKIPNGQSRDFTIHYDLPIGAGNGFQNKTGTVSINFEAAQERNNTLLPQGWENRSTTSPGTTSPGNVTLVARNLAYTDLDPTPGSIDGEITWDAAADESNISSYQVYVLNESNEKVLRQGTVNVPKGSSYSVPVAGQLRPDTKKFAVYSVNNQGVESATPAIVVIVDKTS